MGSKVSQYWAGTVAHNYNPGCRLNTELKPGIPSEVLSPKHKSIIVLALKYICARQVWKYMPVILALR